MYDDNIIESKKNTNIIVVLTCCRVRLYAGLHLEYLNIYYHMPIIQIWYFELISIFIHVYLRCTTINDDGIDTISFEPPDRWNSCIQPKVTFNVYRDTCYQIPYVLHTTYILITLRYYFLGISNPLSLHLQLLRLIRWK